jgi:hypothetical protein
MSPPGMGGGADPDQRAGHHTRKSATYHSADTNQHNAQVGAFPQCSRCGARVLHHAAAVCSHCRIGPPASHAPIQPERPADTRTFLQRRADRKHAERGDGELSNGRCVTGKTFHEFVEEFKAETAEPAPHSVGQFSGPRPTAAPGANPAYVAAAIKGELAKLTNATEGVRNHTLYTASRRIAELLKAGHACGEQGLRDELERIAVSIGLGHGETRNTIQSAWNAATPRDIPASRTTYEIQR